MATVIKNDLKKNDEPLKTPLNSNTSEKKRDQVDQGFKEMVEKIKSVYPELAEKLSKFKESKELPDALGQAAVEAISSIVTRESLYETMLKDSEEFTKAEKERLATLLSGNSIDLCIITFKEFIRSKATKEKFLKGELETKQLLDGQLLQEIIELHEAENCSVEPPKTSNNWYSVCTGALNLGVFPKTIIEFLKLKEQLNTFDESHMAHMGDHFYILGYDNDNFLLKTTPERIQQILRLDIKVLKEILNYNEVQWGLLLDSELSLPLELINKVNIVPVSDVPNSRPFVLAMINKIKNYFKEFIQKEISKEAALAKLEKQWSLINEDSNPFAYFGIAFDEIFEEGFVEECTDLHAFVLHATPFRWKEIRDLHYSQLLALAHYGLRKELPDDGTLELGVTNLEMCAQKSLTVQDVDNDWWTPKHTEALRVLHYDMIANVDAKKIDELLYTPCRQQKAKRGQAANYKPEKSLFLSKEGSTASAAAAPEKRSDSASNTLSLSAGAIKPFSFRRNIFLTG